MSKSEIHSGYEFEEGMFSRMRSWVDVAPWIRLARTLRLLASPTYVGLVAVAWAITRTAYSYWFDVRLEATSRFGFESDMSLVFQTWASAGVTWSVLFIVAALLLWIPVLQCVSRAGAALTVGKILPPQGEGGKILLSRLWQSYLIPIVPIGCVSVFAVLVFVLRIPSLIVGNEFLSTATGWMIGIGAIPIGVLTFGALFAIPLGLAAMVVEPDPDPIDSLSRGYEYLYRRPLSIAWYVVVAGALIYLADKLIGGVALASSLAVQTIVMTFSADKIQAASAVDAIGIVVVAWRVTLAFALLGGIYLLLRRDAGGQEVEDFWSPPKAPNEPLPELPKEAYQS